MEADAGTAPLDPGAAGHLLARGWARVDLPFDIAALVAALLADGERQGGGAWRAADEQAASALPLQRWAPGALRRLSALARGLLAALGRAPVLGLAGEHSLLALLEKDPESAPSAATQVQGTSCYSLEVATTAAGLVPVAQEPGLLALLVGTPGVAFQLEAGGPAVWAGEGQALLVCGRLLATITAHARPSALAEPPAGAVSDGAAGSSSGGGAWLTLRLRAQPRAFVHPAVLLAEASLPASRLPAGGARAEDLMDGAAGAAAAAPALAAAAPALAAAAPALAAAAPALAAAAPALAAAPLGSPAGAPQLASSVPPWPYPGGPPGDNAARQQPPAGAAASQPPAGGPSAPGGTPPAGASPSSRAAHPAGSGTPFDIFVKAFVSPGEGRPQPPPSRSFRVRPDTLLSKATGRWLRETGQNVDDWRFVDKDEAPLRPDQTAAELAGRFVGAVYQPGGEQLHPDPAAAPVPVWSAAGGGAAAGPQAGPPAGAGQAAEGGPASQGDGAGGGEAGPGSQPPAKRARLSSAAAEGPEGVPGARAGSQEGSDAQRGIPPSPAAGAAPPADPLGSGAGASAAVRPRGSQGPADSGSGQPAGAAAAASAASPSQAASPRPAATIALRFQMAGSGGSPGTGRPRTVTLAIKPHAPLSKAVRTLAGMKNPFVASVFTWQGRALQDGDTAASLGMTENDTVLATP